MMAEIFNVILVFFYIFGFAFKGGEGIDSSILVLIFLIIELVLHKKYFEKVFNFAMTLYARNIFVIYIVINIYLLMILIANQSSDFSYFKTFFHMFVLIIEGMLLYQYFVFKGKDENIINYIIMAFVLQTAIQWLAFVLPPFKALINYTKSAATIARGVSYSGVRANALSGSDFFGLSTAYAIVALIFFSKKNTIANNRALKFMIGIFMITGVFFSGRTGYIGVAFALLFLLIKPKQINDMGITVKELFVYIIGGIGVLGVVGMLVRLYTTSNRYQNLFHFTFQSVFNYISRGSASTSSMESLKNMYFNIPFTTFILGDGKYTMEGGKYYMSTDVGYMRVILLMGIVGFLLLLFLQLFLMQVRKGSERLLKGLLLALLLVLNLKGEVIAWGQITIGIITLFCIQDIFSNKNEVIEHESTYGFNDDL